MHDGAQLANSLTKEHEPAQLRMFFNIGHRWELVYDTKYQSAQKRRAAGILPAAGAARQDFPDYESPSRDDSDEDSMLSLEEPLSVQIPSKGKPEHEDLSIRGVQVRDQVVTVISLSHRLFGSSAPSLALRGAVGFRSPSGRA